MKHLLIVFHSQSGRNQRLALALYQRASQHGQIQTRLLNAFEATAADWLWSDAFILITPENFAAIAGGMKQFLDRIYYPCLAEQEKGGQQGKPYLLVIGTGNDGSQCEFQLTRILKGLSAKPVQDSLFIYGEPTEADIAAMHELAEGFTEALSMGVF